MATGNASAGEAASETALPAALTQTDMPTRLPYTVYTISVSFFLNYRRKKRNENIILLWVGTMTAGPFVI